MQEIADWLEKLGMSGYAQRGKRTKVTGAQGCGERPGRADGHCRRWWEESAHDMAAGPPRAMAVYDARCFPAVAKARR